MKTTAKKSSKPKISADAKAIVLAVERIEKLIMPRSIAANAEPVKDSRFTKLDATLQNLPDSATHHVAVRDNTSGLIWTADKVGSDRVTHSAAVAACKKFDLAGCKEWRLPTIQELLTIVDYERSDPAIDTRFFKNAKSAWYWSSSPCAAYSDHAWLVGFDGGVSDWLNRNNNGFVRAVRASQS